MIVAIEQYSYSEIQKTETILKNDKCIIEYDADRKEISGRDLVDRINEPAFYSTSKRGIAKAWQKLSEKFNGEMALYNVTGLLSNDFNIRTHSWCMMD